MDKTALIEIRENHSVDKAFYFWSIHYEGRFAAAVYQFINVSPEDKPFSVRLRGQKARDYKTKENAFAAAIRGIAQRRSMLSVR